MTAVARPTTTDQPSRDEMLSSLADGECPPGTVADACRQWRTDADLRDSWHAYQLIGDVLRSDSLGNSASHDQAFLQQLRVRLAQEPVPLATAPLIAPARPRRWMAPAAVVAGFVVVGAAVAVLGPADKGPTGWENPVAQTAVPSGTVMRQVSGAAAAASAHTWVIDGQVIRDARLDAYFEAHRGALGAAPSALPGGALRSVEILVPQR